MSNDVYKSNYRIHRRRNVWTRCPRSVHSSSRNDISATFPCQIKWNINTKIDSNLTSFTLLDSQLLSAMNHHLSLADRKLRLPTQWYLARSLSNRITWQSAGRNVDVRLMIWLFSIFNRDSRSSQLCANTTRKTVAFHYKLLINYFTSQIVFNN